VRREAKQRPATKSLADRSGPGGLLARLALAALGAILAAMLLAGPAAAAPQELEHFGCTGGVACERLSVDEASGDVYVVDPTNNSVDRYSKTGTLLSQLKVPAGEGGSFGFGGAPDVAVDNSGTATQGRVYVSQGEASTKVFAFDPSNKAEPFLWAAGGFGEACGIAVDPSGMPWEGDWGEGVQQLNPADGSKTGIKITTIEGPCHIAFDSSGNALINQWNGGIHKTTQTGELVEPPVGGSYEPSFGSQDVAVDTFNDDVYGVETEIVVWNAEGTTRETFGPTGIGATVDAFRGRLYVAHGSEVSVYAVPGVTFPLTVSVEGEGSGQVDADTGAIEGCTKSGGTCTGEYGYEAEVTLTATAGEHSTFAGWSGGGCSGTEPTCTVTTTEATEVTATFDSTMRTLTVNKTGSGTVECKLGAGSFGPCAAAYDAGSKIEVKATPGAHFAQGAIGGTGSAAGCTASPCSFPRADDRRSGHRLGLGDLRRRHLRRLLPGGRDGDLGGQRRLGLHLRRLERRRLLGHWRLRAHDRRRHCGDGDLQRQPSERTA